MYVRLFEQHNIQKGTTFGQEGKRCRGERALPKPLSLVPHLLKKEEDWALHLYIFVFGGLVALLGDPSCSLPLLAWLGQDELVQADWLTLKKFQKKKKRKMEVNS